MAANHDVAALLQDYSLEVTARQRSGIEACRDHLPKGSEVYIAFVPGETHHAVVAAARALDAVGFAPVPHVTARNFPSFTQLDDFLARLAGEAGVDAALVVAGDLDQAAGPYHAALDVLQTGLFERHGFRRIGLACYPEEHRQIAADQLDRALLAKLDYLGRIGLEPWLVSQFCFEAAPILERARAIRTLGVRAPLTVGLAGPADRRTLWKYALHCGIGNSIRALGARVDAVANLLARRTPDDLVGVIATAAEADPALGIAGVHIFTFGGVAQAARWANGLRPQQP